MRVVRPIGRVGRGPILALALISVLVLIATGCSKSSPETPSYAVFVQKFRYHGMPSSIPSGNLILNFSNRESLPITHELILLALPSGQTKQNIIDDAKSKGPDAEGDYLSFGEIGEVDTGSTHAAVFDLPAGTYAFACFETGNLGAPDAKGKAHAARGMVFQFTVT